MKRNVQSFWLFFRRHPRHAFRFVSLSILLFMLGYTGVRSTRWAGNAFFACPIIDVTCTNCYSPIVKKELVAFVRSNLSDVNLLSFHATNFYSSLQARFNYVTKVTIIKRVPMGLSVKINGVKPTMFINENLVLGEDRSVYPRNYFTSYVGLDDLPRVTMPAIHVGMQVTPWVYEGLQKLAPRLSKNYDFAYINPSTIRLVPRMPQRYAVVVANESVLADIHQLDGLDDIVQDAVQRGLCSLAMLETKRRSVELDLRFERRIIVKFIDHAKRRGKVS